jgi:NAD-dependent deacetylase
MQRIVVFTGAGMSAESGIKTFRDSGGLWEEYNVADVATPEAWEKNRTLVLDFYNQRRKQVIEARPNAAHLALAQLSTQYQVDIITQNIDDLHERAGSKNVLHLHGEIMKSRSSRFPGLVYDIDGWEIKEGDVCEKGFQLRPHIVWFGEMVPEMERAIMIAMQADYFIVIGSSLEVYPAASLINYAPAQSVKYLVDPKAKPLLHIANLEIIQKNAAEAVPVLVNKLLKQHV